MTIVDDKQVLVLGQHRPEEVSSAFSSAITFIVANSFTLAQEEASWLAYNVQQIMAGFEERHVASLPNAVSLELKTRQYSTTLSSWEGGRYVKAGNEMEAANLDGWLDVIMDMIAPSYDLGIMEAARTRARFRTIFEELGVGGGSHPRVATYLPNAVRYIVNNRD